MQDSSCDPGKRPRSGSSCREPNRRFRMHCWGAGARRSRPVKHADRLAAIDPGAQHLLGGSVGARARGIRVPLLQGGLRWGLDGSFR